MPARGSVESHPLTVLPLEVRYDEHTVDIAENRLLLTADDVDEGVDAPVVVKEKEQGATVSGHSKSPWRRSAEIGR